MKILDFLFEKALIVPQEETAVDIGNSSQTIQLINDNKTTHIETVAAAETQSNSKLNDSSPIESNDLDDASIRDDGVDSVSGELMIQSGTSVLLDCPASNTIPVSPIVWAKTLANTTEILSNDKLLVKIGHVPFRDSTR